MEASGIQDIVTRMLGSLNVRESRSIKKFCDTISRTFEEAFAAGARKGIAAGYRRLAARIRSEWSCSPIQRSG